MGTPDPARLMDARNLLKSWLDLLDLLESAMELFERRQAIEEDLATLEREQAANHETARRADETRRREQAEAETAVRATHEALLRNLAQTEASRRTALDTLAQRIVDLKAERQTLDDEAQHARAAHAQLVAGLAQERRAAEQAVESLRAQLRAVRDGIAV